MSINNFTEVQGFSISGLQNITADTINGNTVLTTITIAGQTAFLSYDSTTSTLTLLIPTSNGVVSVGLLSATDWNTFNNKENGLTFISPLRRIGDVIDFDFSTANTFTGVNTFSNLVNFNGNIQCNALPNAITPNALYIDGTGLVSYGSVPADLLPLNNIWTGSDNTFQNEVIVENLAQLQYAFRAYINKFVHPTLEFFYVEVNGDVGFFGQLNPLYPLPAGGPVWKITSSGDANFVSANIQNTLVVENLQGAGDAMRVFINGTIAPSEFLYFTNAGTLGYNTIYSLPFAFPWNITQLGVFTINDVRGYSAVFENNENVPNSIEIYRNKTTFATEFIYYNNVGEFGNSLNTWKIQRNGDIEGSTLLINNTNNNFDPMRIFRSPAYPTEYLYLDNNGEFGYNGPLAAQWSIIFGVMTMPIIQTISVLCTNNASRNFFKFTHFEPSSPTYSNWISAEFSYDGVDKPVIGNLGLALGGYGSCFGSHDTTLGAWRDCWINPGATTYTGNLNATAFNYPSDRRIKKEISYLDASKSIKFVKGLKPAKFKKCVDNRIEFLKNEGEKFELGFIAQDIQEIAETESQKMIVTTETYLEKERLTIKPFYIIAELVNANKEMIDKIERLEAENKLLQERLLKIENLIVKKKCLAFI